MDTPADPYKAVEPVLDGCYIHLTFLKDVVCPGTFVLFSGGDQFGDHAVGQIITVTKNSDVMLNPFQALNEEDGIASLNNPHLNNLPEVRSFAVCMLQVAIFILLLMSIFLTCFIPQIIQTAISFIVRLEMITDFVFVFSDYEITHQNVEVQGIERFRVLHGHASENGNGMESIYVPPFPSQLPLFDTHYNLHADISFALWHEVICLVRGLLT